MNRCPTLEPLDLETTYPHSRRQVDPNTWRRAVAAYQAQRGSTPFHDILAQKAGRGDAPPYLGDLALLEYTLRVLHSVPSPQTPVDREPTINPTLQLISTPWSGLARLLDGAEAPEPEPGGEQMLAWRTPEGEVRVRASDDADLLALKLVAEEQDLRQVAREQGVSVAWLNQVVGEAAAEGLLLVPPSALIRPPDRFPAHEGVDPAHREAAAFTLQWHITHACDLHCRHCYDRSRRSDLTLAQGLGVLDDLYGFCRERHVQGQVTFTGGNPLMLPEFPQLYRAAVERGFLVAILGNPAPREEIEELVAIEPPDFFQVSLEGLQKHNDHIRGEGHFDRVMEFLPVLRDLGVHSMVMLTLTRDNRNQVLPLGELLRDVADTFHWNRLSPVGEGAQLAVVPPEEFRPFLEEYLAAAKENPILGIKDNLINPVRDEWGRELFGGCTGHGCGAAFNFLSVLPDGEAHACRKFPSPVGNVLQDGIAAVYDSPAAAHYRAGSDACRECHLAAVCGGCMASTQGLGKDPFVDRDPYCWKDSSDI